MALTPRYAPQGAPLGSKAPAPQFQKFSNVVDATLKAHPVFMVGDLVEAEEGASVRGEPRWDVQDDRGATGRYIQGEVIEFRKNGEGSLVWMAVKFSGIGMWFYPLKDNATHYHAGQWFRPGYVRHRTPVKRCECGAQATANKNLHAFYCPLYQK